ncbi:hypothetical protein EJ065_3473 [Corallococcus coralloides]|uniref:Uncharacterized protein n=1 Tax=Corallococcus coralloides TaxID=184914 RepID=A0A410RSZ4_CORCK|nr:hypothetical protein [Corallococcus coralloides]QAT85034.1 hypothetical protein EJ065_3473 [Corallococcus coralloides]
MNAQGMDATYRRLTQHLPAPLRQYGGTLPHRLGLTRWKDGCWEDFWVLDINRDLPGYAAEDPDRPGHLLVPREVLAHYRAAHHCAAIHGLIADRLVDRQVAPDVGMLVYRGVFLRSWEHELAAALDNRRLARQALAKALVSLRRGTALELKTMALRRMDVATYAVQTREKLRWGGTAAVCLLRHAGQPERAALLERSYDRFCFALQCLDDALDCEEDERTRGTSIPAVLGLPEGALVRALPFLMESAITLAEQARLVRLSTWMRGFARLVGGIQPDGVPAHNEEAGRRLASAAEEVL